MKRILSVILSLALLASLLIIPMSVSAGDSGDGVVTTTFMYDNSSDYTADIDTDLNLAKGITPLMFVTKDGSRTQKDSPTGFSDGTATAASSEPNPGFTFSNDSTNFINGYDPSADFVFTKSASQYDAFVDVIYDLGCVADINKIQHFGHLRAGLTLGAYSVYASTDVNNLFNRDESLVVDYQNKDVANSQQFEFPTRPARFVAFRIYCPVTAEDKASASNQLRIWELAIYGTQTGAYKVTEISAPTGDANSPTDVPNKESDLLTADTFESINAYEDGKLVGTQENIFSAEAQLGKLNSQTYLHNGHGDFNGGVVFYANNTCKNGYSFNRSGIDGNIVFNVPATAPKVYYDFTYDLGDYHKITSFGAYLASNDARRVQAYEVYIGNDRDELYNGEPVAVYNNYYNTYGQMITFDQAKVGKYIGFRVLNPSTATDDGNTYVRIDELAAYGECVGAPPAIDVAPGETCGSVVVTVTDEDNNLESVTLDGTPVTLENGKFTVSEIGDYTVVATDKKGNETTKEFTVADHNYQYTADGAVITETCANCDRPAETLTLKVVDGPLVYDGSDKSGSIDVEKTTGFAGWEGGIDFEIDGKPAESVINAGDYVAKATIDGVAFAELPFTIKKADPTYDVPTGLEAEAGGKLKDIELPSNFTWGNPNGIIKYNEKEYDAVYTPVDTDNYNTVELKVSVNVTDTTVPTGEIKIKNKTWIEEVVDVLFGWFINKQETVTITGSDNYGSGVDKIYYYVADAKLDSFENIEWKEYTDPFKIEKEGNNVVYAKVVDKAGNSSAIINTDGIVLDATAPVADVTDLGKYYGSLTVTVTEDNLDTVKLNDEVVTLEDGKFTVSAADKEQTIVITDKAGNETTYKVTVVEVKGFVPADGKLTVDMDEKNIDKADKDKIAAGLDKGETVTFFDISVDNATSTTTNVLEVPVDFDFTGKLDVKVLHNHGGVVNDLKALTARPTADFENGTFFADVENKLLYIYTKEFSTFAVAFHVHDLKHVEAKAATAEADGNIEYWYCEGCDKYFSDAAATKEITKESTVVKYVAPSNGNTGNSNAPTTGGEAENNATVPGGTSPVTGETAMTVVLFAILLGALAVMGISIVKSRKAKSK